MGILKCVIFSFVINWLNFNVIYLVFFFNLLYFFIRSINIKFNFVIGIERKKIEMRFFIFRVEWFSCFGGIDGKKFMVWRFFLVLLF